MQTEVKTCIFPENMSFEEIFTVVNTATVFGHPIMEYCPTGLYETNLYRNLQQARKNHLPPFRAPIMDPSWEGDKLVYKFGNKPAIGLRGKEWAPIARNFMPEKKSSLGTQEQRAVLLAELMIYFMDEEHCTAEEAYRRVVRGAKPYGHFYGGPTAECAVPTGSNPLANRYDWANTAKFIHDGGNDYMLTSSHYYHSFSYTCWEDDQVCSMAFIDKDAREATPWIVTEV